jgi:gas vesicle protein
MKDDKGDSSFGIGLMAGLALGVTLGILFAPKSGEETREEVTGFLDKILSKLQWLLYTPEQRYLHLWNRTRGSE